jgi:hypothetical protein
MSRKPGRKPSSRSPLAGSRVHYALRIGLLVRQPCEVCGATKHIHGHHDDYDKPLEVRWLCAKHHAAWHKTHGEGKNRTRTKPIRPNLKCRVLERTVSPVRVLVCITCSALLRRAFAPSGCPRCFSKVGFRVLE